MDEASSQVVNSIDSVNSQELAMDIDFDSLKAEIVSSQDPTSAIW